LDEPKLLQLAELVAEFPDATLEELRELLRRRCRLSISVNTVCRVFTTSRRTKRGKRRAEWLLFIMIALDWTPEQCRQRYRKRFGVETSYRLGNKLLGWTTSPNAAYRFLLIGLGFLLLNIWVHLCWLYTQVARRG